MARKAGLKLRCNDGTWEQAAFTIRAVAPDGGCEVWMACDFGRGLGGVREGHWLAPDPRDPSRLVVVARQYVWDTARAASAALDAWASHAALERECAALREIVAAVAGYDATYCGIEIGHECALNAQQRARTGGQDFGCHWNKFEDDRTRHMFVHGENCPVTRARALLADTQTPGQESE